MQILSRTNKIQVICPICNKRDIVGIPPSSINKKSKLTTLSVHKGLICPHHFQFFMDNNFQIRGYQKVDLELNNANATKLKNGVKAFNLNQNNRKDLFEQLIIEGDSIKCKGNNQNDEKKNSNSRQNITPKKKKMTSKEIYEEFWEFIDENNEIFHDFIIKDNRRSKSSINSHISECITI
jgi:hypothetical protein